MPGTWTYDPAQLMTSQLMQVRRLIGDTNTADQQLFNEEILWAISQRGNSYGAAADCCRQLSAKYSRDVDTVQGELHRLYSARQRAYSDRAKEMDRIAGLTGKGAPYAGGISQADKRTQEDNSDRVEPQFNIGMTDNWQPVGPVGNETQGGRRGGGEVW